VPIAIIFGIGSRSNPIQIPPLGTLAFGTIISRWRMKRKQKQKVLNPTFRRSLNKINGDKEGKI
jgi:hypothetical protein